LILDYVQELFKEVRVAIQGDEEAICTIGEEVVPPPLNKEFVRPNKAEAVKDFYTRYHQENE